MKWSKDQNKKTPMWTGKILTNNDPLNEQTRTKKMTCIWKKKKKKKNNIQHSSTENASSLIQKDKYKWKKRSEHNN